MEALSGHWPSSLPQSGPADHSAEERPGKAGGTEEKRRTSNHFPSSPTTPRLHYISVLLQDGSQLVLSSHCPGQRLGARREVFPTAHS